MTGVAAFKRLGVGGALVGATAPAWALLSTEAQTLLTDARLDVLAVGLAVFLILLAAVFMKWFIRCL